MSVLPDTCAWIDFLRGSATPLASALRHALREGITVTCGAVLYELLKGVRTEAERQTMIAAFGALPFLELSPELWASAGGLAARLRSKGHTLPMSDVLIAALALHHKAVVLTVDRHFEAIEGLEVDTGQR